ncbi:MAG: response regulator [Deltaproteobacteria bacterium]|nr:response regulator [Deltaproteobacteria bacterium]MBW1923644.1 response regulator [Deltaproteobacteria bacterium]MBW1948605.1 response regulator [Deltaproteobacteria bacterium]MBW2007945.1 response regulator [Deltaproteobacteria bacterium]MBW2349069.1 response regulator [Deltaproteobacteria bacterium]
MDTKKIIKGKRVLIVDDEEDILEFLTELLEACKLDRALSFEEGKALLERNFYHVAVLDIMGVRGYDLLEIARSKNIPAIMLTAHALSTENLKRSFKEGAAYYVPKDEINNIDVYVGDVIEATEKKKNVWLKWYERLSGFCDRRFGPKWKEEDPEFWNTLFKY